MSAAAAWSYTSKATLWPLLGRDDWTGALLFGPPVVFACDYSAESLRLTDDAGVEFTTRQVLFTEFATAKQGDRVLIGESAEADPIAAGAFEVRAVTRYADTFDLAADDFRIAT
jgi:hypothetical protein